MDEMTAEGLDHYRKNQSRKDGDWDLNTLSKIKVQHAETLEELLAFLCSVHKWKKDVPSLVVIDDIASLLSGSSRSYQEMLGIVSHIQNALLSLSDELRDEASRL
jgi:RecA-family ATPase